MKVTADHHVHTRVSGCCKESYDLVDAWARAQDLEIKHLGITDHDVPFKNKYLFDQVARAREHDGLHVGMEVTIRDGKGGIQVARRVLDQLDFLVLSEHVHVMPAHTIFKQARRNLQSWWRLPGKQHLVDRFYSKLASMSTSAITRHEPAILAHPWRFPWHAGILDAATIDAYEPVLAAAARAGTRIEFSRVVMGIAGRDLDGTYTMPGLPPWRGTWQHETERPVPFFTRFFAACKAHGLRLALGSDAHKLADVASFPDLDRTLQALGIPASMIDEHVVA